MDLPNAMSIHEVADKLSLKSIKNRMWFIQPCIAILELVGILEGLDWLAKACKI